MSVIKLLNNVNLEGYTLIIPSVCFGNVPQLAVDLLITNCNLQRGGILWHPAIVPSVGADPFGDSPETCTACELYINQGLKLAVIQIRTFLEGGLVTCIFDDLKADIVQFKVAKLLILSAAYDHELHTVGEGKYFYFDSNGINESLVRLGVRPKQPYVDGTHIVQGGGYTVKLYETMKDVCPCTVLIKYVSEGDNRPDAVNILEFLCNYFENLRRINVESIVFPSSWEYLYGDPAPDGMF